MYFLRAMLVVHGVSHHNILTRSCYSFWWGKMHDRNLRDKRRWRIFFIYYFPLKSLTLRAFAHVKILSWLTPRGQQALHCSEEGSIYSSHIYKTKKLSHSLLGMIVTQSRSLFLTTYHNII